MSGKRRVKNSGSRHSGRAKPRQKPTPKKAGTEALSGRVLSLSEAISMAKRERAKGSVIVTTNGCFDILHIGHVRYLRSAKRRGDILIVGVNSDRSVRRNKGDARPIVPERERAELVASLKAVDAVFIFDDTTPVTWLAALKPDVHVKGADRTMDEVVEKKVVEASGGKVVLAPYVRGHSTTGIIKKICGGDAP